MPIYDVEIPPPVLRSRGAVCPIKISLPQILKDRLTKQSQEIPTPESGRALIDTGASVSVVDLSVIRKLQISSIGVAKVGTAGGPIRRNLYPARFILPRLAIELGRVIGANLGRFQIIAIIGRDILSKFILIYHGPAGRITLTS